MMCAVIKVSLVNTLMVILTLLGHFILRPFGRGQFCLVTKLGCALWSNLVCVAATNSSALDSNEMRSVNARLDLQYGQPFTALRINDHRTRITGVDGSQLTETERQTEEHSYGQIQKQIQTTSDEWTERQGLTRNDKKRYGDSKSIRGYKYKEILLADCIWMVKMNYGTMLNLSKSISFWDIVIFHFFKMDPSATLDFENAEILFTDGVLRAEMRHSVKSYQNRLVFEILQFVFFQDGGRPPSWILKMLKSYWLMASEGSRCITVPNLIKSSQSVRGIMRFFYFSRWCLSAIFNLFEAYLDNPRRLLGRVHRCAKFGSNWCSSFSNMTVWCLAWKCLFTHLCQISWWSVKGGGLILRGSKISGSYWQVCHHQQRSKW